MHSLPTRLVVLVGVASIALATGSGSTEGQINPRLAVAGPLAAILTDTVSYEDPFPIQRIRANESEIDSILKQTDVNPLVQLRRSDFEARVRAAGRKVSEARTVARITHTRYAATLVGGDLVGTAEIDLTNSSPVPQFLALDPLRLALTSAAWADGRAAWIGVPSGSSTTSVWVDRSGEQTLKFGWSAAGTTEFGERRFEMRVPPALSTVLELDLPLGQRPTVTTDVLLTGPFPLSNDPTRARWRFQFAGRHRLLEFTIRSTGASGVTATATLAARYDISPGLLTSTFEYDLHPAKGTVGEWRFTIDPGLRVTDVVVNNRAGWSIESTSPGGQGLFRVTLNQPGNGGKMLITCLSPFPDPLGPADSPLPAIRPVSAVIDDESLEIHISPELKPRKWLPGDYRLTDSQILADQSQLLVLTGTLLPAGVDRVFRQTPSLQVAPSEPEIATKEQIAWRFDNDRVSAQIQIGFRVRRGPLFRLILRPAPEYTFIKASSIPDDLIASTTFSDGGVIVEFKHSLLVDQTADVTFEFRGPNITSTPIAFPAFSPLNATERIGVLGINPGSLWDVNVKPGVGMTPTNWLDLSALRQPADAALAYRYAGGNPNGSLVLSAKRPKFTASISNRYDTSEFKTVAKTTISVGVQSGSLSSLIVMEPDTYFGGRSWKLISGGNSIASAVAIPLAEFMSQFGRFVTGLPSHLNALSEREKIRLGNLWFIRLAHQTSGEIVLETTASRENSKGIDSDRIQLAPMCIFGSLDTQVLADKTRVQPDQPAAERTWRFADVYQVTFVRAEDDVEIAFGGRIISSADKLFPVRLPVGARVRSVFINGRLLDRGMQELSSEGILSVPITSMEQPRFEVWYQLPANPGFLTHIKSPEPGLPGVNDGIRHRWAIGSNLLVYYPIELSDQPKSTDLPVLQENSSIVSPGVVVLSTDSDEVVVSSTRTANGIGVSIGVLFFLLGWFGRARHSSHYGLLMLGGLFAFGTINLLGPTWWQRASAIPLAIGLPAMAGMLFYRCHRAVGTFVAVVSLCTLSPTLITAQTIPPAVVVLLPPDADGRENVVVPKAVLDRLAAIERTAPPGVLITSAEYAVSVDENSAHIIARWSAQALGDSNFTASLPLSDARLERVFVEGKPALPNAQKLGLYTVPLLVGGRHELEVHFVAPVNVSGIEKEIHFGVPECPNARLTALLPSSARQVQLVGRIGKQTLSDGNPRRFEVEVGCAKTIQLRWRDGVGGTASTKVREACIWDVGEKTAELTAAYNFRVEQGTVSTLRFELPVDLEPVDVSLRGDATGGTALRDWSLANEQNGYRQLRLDLQGQTSGRFVVVLSCRLKRALTAKPLLRFPKPYLPVGNAEEDIIYGLRVKETANKMSMEELVRNGTIDYDPGALIRDKDWVQVPALKLDSNAPMLVLRPTPNAIPELRPTLRPGSDNPIVNLETSWHLEPKRAEAKGTIHWSRKEPLSLLEFTIPGVRILEVRGPEVGAWNESGGRVYVWFRKPSGEGEVEWLGTMLISKEQQNANPVAFEAVVPHVVDARVGTEIVRIRPLENYAIRTERDRGWTVLNRRDEGLAFQKTSPTALPVRVLLNASASTSPFGSSGQTSKTPPSQIALEPSTKQKPKPGALDEPLAKPSDNSSTETTRPWVLPMPAILCWSLSFAILTLLFVRFQQATWPEQFGLIAGLFGVVVLGHWWLGPAGWVVARMIWLSEKVRHAKVPNAQPAQHE